MVTALAALAAPGACGCARSPSDVAPGGEDRAGAAEDDDPLLPALAGSLRAGRRVFRHDTFGGESFWGDRLKLHRAIAGEALGGAGPGLGPRRLAALGFKIDAEALPPALGWRLDDTAAGGADDPAVSVELLRVGAVVGVTGLFERGDALTSLGLHCALCHSTVDDAAGPGVGRRLDGWPNRNVDVGAFLALAPTLAPLAELVGADEASVRATLMRWGPGRFDAAFLRDGIAARPDGGAAATLIPPLFGAGALAVQGWTGGGSLAHAVTFAANWHLMGRGTFLDARLSDPDRYATATRARLGRKRQVPDHVTGKITDLLVFLLALPVPPPPPGSFDAAAAARGRQVFSGRGYCERCHVPPHFSEPGWPMHAGEEIGIDDFQARRGSEGRYRTAPLRGLHAHAKGGYYHDGRFPTLESVVDHYDRTFELRLRPAERRDLIEFLKSL